MANSCEKTHSHKSKGSWSSLMIDECLLSVSLLQMLTNSHIKLCLRAAIWHTKLMHQFTLISFLTTMIHEMIQGGFRSFDFFFLLRSSSDGKCQKTKEIFVQRKNFLVKRKHEKRKFVCLLMRMTKSFQWKWKTRKNNLRGEKFPRNLKKIKTFESHTAGHTFVYWHSQGISELMKIIHVITIT